MTRRLHTAALNCGIGEAAAFTIKGYDKSCIVGRLDFVESILRLSRKDF